MRKRKKRWTPLFVILVLFGLCVGSRLYLDAIFEELIPQEGFEAGFFDALAIDAARTLRDEYMTGEDNDNE